MTKLICNISGRIGSISSLETSKAGKPFLSIGICEKVNDAFIWHNFTVWNGLAKTAAAHLKKGDVISLDFGISYREVNDKKFTNFTARDIRFIDLKKE